MLFISKKTADFNQCEPYDSVYLQALKAGCKLVSLSRMAFPQSCSCQGDCCIYYACAVFRRNLPQENTSWEIPAGLIIALLFSKVLENAQCTWSKNFTIRVYEI